MPNGDLVELAPGLFPPGPLRVVPGRRERGLKRFGFGFASCLLVPSLYFASSLFAGERLKHDLRERGVATAVVDATGECRTLRNRITNEHTPSGCDLDIEYRLRPEHGATLRKATVRLAGGAPIFHLPPAIYDPEAPSRVMLEPEISSSADLGQIVGASAFFVLAALALVGTLSNLPRGLAGAARDPRPALVRIVRMVRSKAYGHLDVHFRSPGAAADTINTFSGREPFLVERTDTPGQLWGLALVGPNGRAHLLDSALTMLELDQQAKLKVWNKVGA